MLKYTLPIVIVLNLSSTFLCIAQDCEAVNKENEQLQSKNSQLTADLKDLQSENAYLKDALKIYSPIEEAKVDDIKFNVTECIGSKSKQEVAVTIVLINEEANNYYQMGRSNLIDPQGETHKSYRASFDDNKMGTTLTTDVPTRAQLVFKNALPKITIIKSLQLINNSGYVVVEFKDIPITWE